MPAGFFQDPPTLGNTFLSDTLLRELLARKVPADARVAMDRELSALGELMGGELYEMFLRGAKDEPKLTSWSAWGRRKDEIELTPLWQRAATIATKFGLIATPYEKAFGAYSRLHQMAMVHLFHASSAVYTCPLAMTDGAAKTLLRSGNQALIDRALPRLTSRDPATAWTSGQWMTERTGGSDVAICETVAKAREDGTFGLYGTKWFTSATTSQMALTLGRPEGNPPGGSGLALFYVEVRKADQTMNGISIHRLKDKLGTRHVPTAELGLDGTIATPVMGLRDGIKNITPMLSITRTWNAVCAVSNMRRVVDLARSYARKRVAFGAPLAEKPLHVDTLAWLQAETMGAFLLTFRAVELLGKEEAGEATEREAELLRLLSPIVKLVTARQGVTVATEGIEAFGGAGYVEDTGLPAIVRDNQVLPIWEGTTNVLSLDVLRADGKHGALRALRAEVERLVEHVAEADRPLARAAIDAVDAALGWREEAAAQGSATVEAGARRMAMTLGRALEVALLLEHGVWQAEHGKPLTAQAAAARLVREGVSTVTRNDAREESALLLGL